MTAPRFDGTQACADADLELFFPSQGRNATVSVGKAKALCQACPFARPCLEYAVWAQGVAGRYVDGVWGGTTAGQRAHIRRSQRRAA